MPREDNSSLTWGPSDVVLSHEDECRVARVSTFYCVRLWNIWKNSLAVFTGSKVTYL